MPWTRPCSKANWVLKRTGFHACRPDARKRARLSSQFQTRYVRIRRSPRMGNEADPKRSCLFRNAPMRSVKRRRKATGAGIKSRSGPGSPPDRPADPYRSRTTKGRRSNSRHETGPSRPAASPATSRQAPAPSPRWAKWPRAIQSVCSRRATKLLDPADRRRLPNCSNRTLALPRYEQPAHRVPRHSSTLDDTHRLNGAPRMGCCAHRMS